MSKKIPTCIGVIMDGNRRFAKNKNMPTSFGHKAGYERFKDFLSWAKEAGVEHVIAYCFSTENWKRAQEEVLYLMELLRSGLSELKQDFKDNEFHFVGDLSRFDSRLQKEMEEIEKETHGNRGLKVYLALSYGGRAEILQAVKKLQQEGSEITEDTFAAKLYTNGMPDPDLILRTGGEKRISNFLPWQGVYSELFFTDTLWPAFTKEAFTAILEEYEERERRFGV